MLVFVAFAASVVLPIVVVLAMFAGERGEARSAWEKYDAEVAQSEQAVADGQRPIPTGGRPAGRRPPKVNENAALKAAAATRTKD